MSAMAVAWLTLAVALAALMVGSARGGAGPGEMTAAAVGAPALETQRVDAAAGPADAVTGVRAGVVPMSLAELADRCEHAVTGTVIAVDSYWNEDESQILTDVQIAVEEDFKGNVAGPDGILVLTELGGTVGEDAMVVTNRPSFNVGERVLVFTYLLADGRLIVLGGFQGKLVLAPAPGTTLDEHGNRVDTGAVAESGTIAHGEPGRDPVAEVAELMAARGFTRVRAVRVDERAVAAGPLADAAEVALAHARAELCPANWAEDGMYAGRNPLDELAPRRDAFAKHFASPDGTSTAIISQTPVHYADEQGMWREIRTDIRANPIVDRNGYPYAILENTYQLFFGATLDDGYVVNLAEGDLRLGLGGELRWLTADGSVLEAIPRAPVVGSVTDNTMTFAGTYPAADDLLRVRRRGVDHDIVLFAPPAGPEATTLAFRELVLLPEGWRVEATEPAACGPQTAGGLAVLDQTGYPVAEFVAPVIRELLARELTHDDPLKGSYTERRVESVTGSYHVEATAGGVFVETRAPLAWLLDAERVYPVVVDPTVNCYPSEVAGWTGFSYDSSTCYCGDSSCGDNVRWRGGATVRKGWMYFNTVSIPDGSTINDTVLWYNLGEQNCPYYYMRAMAGFTTSCATVWTYETTGTIYVHKNSCPVTGWNSHDLGATADADLQARLGSDYFGTAFDEYEAGDYYATAYGYYGSNDPYVVVTYTAGALPGDTCATAQNLAGLTSPYSGTTAGYADDRVSCWNGASGGPDRFFYYDVPNYYTIDIWQSYNNFDSVHETRRGATCPGDTQIACTDDDDYTHHTWTNTTGSTQRVWFILDAYGSGSGAFTLNWTVTPIDPCNYVTSIGGCGSGYTQTYNGNGSGVWDIAACGYSTPGIEKVYSFVAPSTGTYSIQVASGGCWVDYFWRASSCSSSGWNCIQDIYSAGTYGAMSWTGGTTYYILLDAETTSSCTHEFYINCPVTAPNISGVSPSSAPAGVGSAGPAGSLVTVTGTNFGTKGANDHMLFWQNGSSYAYDDTYIVSWTDTQIQCYVPATASSKDCAVYKNGTWSNLYTFGVTFSFWYRWLDQSIMPLVYYVNPTASGVDADTTLAVTRASLQAWENVANTYLDHNYRGTTTRDGSNHSDGYNDITWRTGWPYDPGYIAQSTISLSGNIIVETDIECNATNFTWSATGEAGKMDIQNIMAHEGGHGFVGLSDLYGVPDNQKTMYGYSETGETFKRDLAAEDIAGCQWLYPQTGAFAHDACASAINISSLPAYVSGKNSAPYATDDYTSSTCDGPYRNLWWKVTGTGNELVATTCSVNTTFDTEIAVFDGCGGDQVACNDDYSCTWSGLHSTARWCSVYGQTYYISVGSYYQAYGTGSFELYVYEGEATPAAPTGATGDPSTLCQGEATTLSCSAPGAGAVDWYSGSCGGTYVGTGNPLAGVAPAGTTTYYARARNATSGCASVGCAGVTVAVNPVPSNDACGGAATVTLDVPMAGNTADACCHGETLGDCGTGDGSGGALWYKVTGNGNQYTASTCNDANFDTKIRVYTDGCGTLTCVGGNDDYYGTPSCSGNTSWYQWCTEIGREYLILVHGYSSWEGTFNLTVTDDDCSALDDDCNLGTCQQSGGWGYCVGQPANEGGPCGDLGNTDCDNPNTCNAGTCQPNHEPYGTGCTGDGNVCTDDICDGAGSCTHPHNSAPCDDGVFCNGTDTCTGGSCSVHSGDPCSGGPECNNVCNEGAGNCYAAWGTGCTDDSNECTNDVCDGAGACVHPNAPDGTACGDPGNTDCDKPDTCNGVGACLSNYEPYGATCTGDGNDCTSDLCNGTGSCIHPALPDGTGCPDDNDPCTDDECLAGICEHTDNSPTAPTGEQVTPAWVCPGGPASLSATVGPAQALDWYTGGCGGTFVGTGNPLTVYPITTTVYYARARDATTQCESAACVTVTATVDSEAPWFTFTPANIQQNADAGGCAAVLSISPATAADTYDTNVQVTSERSDNPALSLTDPFPAGVTTVTWTASDDCGHSLQHHQYVTINPYNDLIVTTQLLAVGGGSLTRCISFELFDCGGATVPFSEDVLFTAGTSASVNLEVACGDYDCLMAQDELHTLTRRLGRNVGLNIVGTDYVAGFTGTTHGLIGGDLYDDNWIDIIDFGLYVNRWATHYDSNADTFDDGHTPCSWNPTPGGPYHADVSGNGVVDDDDYTFIYIAFLTTGEDDCCRAFGPSGAEGEGPIAEISVAQLVERGLGELVIADLNHDGWVDQADMGAFLEGARPMRVAPVLRPVVTP
ncbi:MAG TPA: IPT/TIG domain-containing protein [Phycisphaerae bacterium]|nr:IPT/TIG domain-containing protein [Phycisphaerae bacterium]HNU44205.1 IPT/TIG domain-containing protein [Phycisphaerae bacterium]